MGGNLSFEEKERKRERERGERRRRSWTRGVTLEYVNKIFFEDGWTIVKKRTRSKKRRKRKKKMKERNG